MQCSLLEAAVISFPSCENEEKWFIQEGWIKEAFLERLLIVL